MNKFKSILLGSVLRVRMLSPLPPAPRAPSIVERSRAFGANLIERDRKSTARLLYEAMTVKELRKRMTARQIKGRSKITRKADIIAALLK